MPIFLIFIIVVSGLNNWICASKKIELQTGASVTIPCHYDNKYIENKKYWCYDKHSAYNYCKIQAYANNTHEKVEVIDYPAESLFTVTMRDLQEENTGTYWCAVEIGGIFEWDETEELYITVKSDPDVSVLESTVSGEEGGNVTVQCKYNYSYKYNEKQWCRTKDWCNTAGTSGKSQNSKVLIRDDGRSFSVQMTRLSKRDTGWYWCTVGALQVPVYLNVTDPSVLTTVTATTHHHTSPVKPEVPTVTRHKPDYSSVSKEISASVTAGSGMKETTSPMLSTIILPLVALCLLGILIIIIIIICMLRKKHKVKNQTRTSTAEPEVTYSSVTFKLRKNKSKQKNLEQLLPEVADSDTLYSTVVHK